MKTRDDLVNSGHVSPHHVMPQSGWVSYWIEKGEEDVAAIIGLFRLRYEQLKPKSHAKQEGKVEQGGFLISMTIFMVAMHDSVLTLESSKSGWNSREALKGTI